jgi:hypothetical protein
LYLKRTLIALLALSLAGCTAQQPASTSEQSKSDPAKTSPSSPGALKAGEASGEIVDEGQAYSMKYSYAGWGRQFDEDAVVLLLTDKPIPAESLDETIKSPYAQFSSNNIHGLEYRVAKSSFWVKYHPSQFQTSGINTLKDYAVEGDTVKGRDEDKDVLDGKEYRRSVSFVARLPKAPGQP